MPPAQSRKKRARKKKKGSLTGKIILYILILVFVSIVFFFANRASSGSFRKLIYMIGSGITGDVSEQASISFDRNDLNVYHSFRRGLAVISPNQLSVFKMSGEESFTEPLIFRSPAVSGCRDSFAAYDRNGVEFIVSNGKKILFRGTAPTKIKKITMNKNGAFTLITDGLDCKSTVTVYNSSLNEIYKLYSSEHFVFDAVLSNDAKTMAVLGYSAKNGGFEGTVTIYSLNTENPIASFSLPDDMPISATFQASNTLLVLTEDSLLSLKINGDKQTLLSFASTELNGYSFKDKYSVILLNGYLGGDDLRLVSLKRNAEPIHLSFDEDIFALSASDNHIAVGFADRIEVYSSNLTLTHTFSVNSDVKRFLIREDGTVLSIGDGFAKLLIS